MITFDFIFICIFLNNVMCKINYASKTLQKHDIGFIECILYWIESVKIYKTFEIHTNKYESEQTAREFRIDFKFEGK